MKLQTNFDLFGTFVICNALQLNDDEFKILSYEMDLIINVFGFTYDS